MSRKLLFFSALSVVWLLYAPLAHADVSTGYISFDITNSPTQGQFDIVGQNGANSSGDATFPVTTTVGLSGLSLDISYASGPDMILSSYFTADADGESYDGALLSLLSGQPSSLSGAIKAVLTGTFATTSFTLFDGSMITVDPHFSASISDATGLKDGDLAVINATDLGPGPGPSPVPEPETLVMVGSGLAALAGLRRRRSMAKLGAFRTRHAGRMATMLALAAMVGAAPIAARAQATVKLNALTSPATGLAGSEVVNLTGSGFPSGSIPAAGVTLTFSKSCGGATVTTEAPGAVSTVAGSTDRAQFLVPGTLTTGTYFVSASGTSAGGVAFTSINCSQIAVTQTTATLAACVPTSSLAVTVGTNVTAYVPFGYWDGGHSGIEQVPLEGAGTTRNFTTAGLVNSCASNSITGEVVCTENNKTVDLINGSALTTLTSGSTSYASFSGGTCQNCGVAINPSNNTAIIGMGVAGGSSGDGVQVLNLSDNTFNTAFAMQHYVSENVSIDSQRNLLLSPGEDGSYTLMKLGANNALTEYGHSIGGTLDSAAEDCTTGIALSADEFTDSIYITDLTQATFTPGSPTGTWTAPGQFISLSDGGYSAGTSGITSAPGTGHLAVVTGEFGGSSYSALKLPATSGTGIPALADYAYVSVMPNTPDGRAFSSGYDPHTITAYTSPNTGKSYAVFVDYALGYPNYLGVVDLGCVLALPRTGSSHSVAGSTASCTRYVAVPST